MSQLSFRKFLEADHFFEAAKYQLTDQDVQEIIALGSKGYSPYGIYTTLADQRIKKGTFPPLYAIASVLKQHPEVDHKSGEREINQGLQNIDNSVKMKQRSGWDKPYLGDEHLDKQLDLEAMASFKDELKQRYLDSIQPQNGIKQINQEHLDDYLNHMVKLELRKGQDSAFRKVSRFAHNLIQKGKDAKMAMRIGWRKLIDSTPTGQEMLRQLFDFSKPDRDNSLSHTMQMMRPAVNPYETPPSPMAGVKAGVQKGLDAGKNAAKNVGRFAWNKTIGDMLPRDNTWSAHYKPRTPVDFKLIAKNSKPVMGAARNAEPIPLD